MTANFEVTPELLAAFREAGVPPALEPLIAGWTAMEYTPDAIKAYVTGHRVGDTEPSIFGAENIGLYLLHGVSARDVRAFQAAGIMRAGDIHLLVDAGCTPQVAAAALNAVVGSAERLEAADRFAALYTAMSMEWASPALMQALLERFGVGDRALLVDAAQMWGHVQVAPGRAALLFAAGVTRWEWEDHPELGESEEALLSVLGALNAQV